MAFRNQISITADTGVGSTTTAKRLHVHLGISPWRWVNGGAIMRIFAAERNMTIEEFGKYLVLHPEVGYDERCDTMIQDFGQQDYVIFEGRLVHHFAPHAFHVRLICDPHVRAERRTKDFPELTVEQVYDSIVERDRVNHRRFEMLYGADVLWSDEKFDLVLDTATANPETIALAIIDAHRTWIEKRGL